MRGLAWCVGAAAVAFAATWANATWEEQAKLVADDGFEDDWLGQSVAICGDVAVVGGTGHDAQGTLSGVAYVYTRDADTWTMHQKLLPPDGLTADLFGTCVTTDGETIMVGAARGDGGVADCGAVYVFTRVDDVWTMQQKITPADGAAYDGFGYDVDLDGDRVAIGSYAHSTHASHAGAVYIHRLIDGVWTAEAKLTAADGAESDFLGHAVSLDGDTCAAGAGNAGTGQPSQGAVYVFVYTDGVWIQQQKLTAPDGAAEDSFGEYVVELEGETIIVGSKWDDDLGNNSGSAYVFTRTIDYWTMQQKLLPSDGEPDAYFAGWAGALQGDTFVAAAHFHDQTGLDSGVAYIFTRTDGVWTEQAKVVGSDTAAGDRFSMAIAIDPGQLIIGAPYHDAGPEDTGAAYIFTTAAPCPGDLDGDDDTDLSDLGILLASWDLDDGGDLDGDGDTDLSDLGILLADWDCGG